MKNIIEDIFGFLYTLSMGDYIFLFSTFLLFVLLIYIIFLLKKDNNSDNYDLNEIKNKIETDYKPKQVNLTDYEEEQERNAIISYDELVKNKDKNVLSYDEEYENKIENIDVKKINIIDNNLNESKEKIEVKLMSYENEEAFLIALKQLQKNLLN